MIFAKGWCLFRFLNRPANNFFQSKQLRKHAKIGMKSIRSLLYCCFVVDFFVSEHSAHSGLCKFTFSMNCFIFSRWVNLSRWMKLSHSFIMQVFKYLFWSVTLQFAANSPDPCIFFCCHSKWSESVVDYRLMKSIRSPLDKAWSLLCCGGFFVSEHSAHSGLCKLKFSMNSYCFFVFSFIFDAGASSNILVKMNETITAVASLSFMM